jgi:hypothetical protein
MGPYRTSLDVIQVVSPCTESWAKMEGTDAVRYCRVCDSNVFDLSALTRQEAEALLDVTEGKACVRFARRADGTVVTKDCAPDRVRHRRRRRRRSLLAGAAALVLTGASAATASVWPSTPPRPPRSHCELPPREPFVPRPTWIDPSELRQPDGWEGALEREQTHLQAERPMYTMGGVHAASPAPQGAARVRLGEPEITDDP